MRILITGATGMLGKDIIEVLKMESDFSLFANQIDHDENLDPSVITPLTFDLTDTSLLERHLREVRPDLIIHCAAIVNVDACETMSEKAMALHAGVVRTFAEHSRSSKLIYISTDSVFDGNTGNYRETDIPNPLNQYASTKYQGELNTLSLFQRRMAIRTNIYGFHVKGNKVSIAEWAIDNLKKGNSISGLTDVRFNPVYTKQLANAVSLLIKVDFNGLIHIASDTFTSKYAFLSELAGTFGFDPGMIKKTTIDQMNFTARRPNNTTLNTDLLCKTLGKVPKFSEGIRQFREDYLLHNPDNAQKE